jgi:hypothetical protein
MTRAWLAKFDESQHPRDEHGRWTDAGGGDTATARPAASKGAGASDAAFAKIEAAVAAIPASHAARIAHVPVVLTKTSDEFPGHIAAGGGASTVGLFGWADDQPRIDVAEAVKVTATITDVGATPQSRQTVSLLPVRQPEQVTVHEMAHALDYVSGWALSDDAALKQRFAAATALMSERETKNASYWIGGGQREMFAELYSAIYNPNRASDQTYFGGMTRARVREVFAPAIASILLIKQASTVRRQSEPPADVQSGWFVSEDGKLFALLGGMPYEVDVAGTPWAGVPLPPGTYADDAALQAAISAERSRQWRLAVAEARAILAKDSAHTDWMNECVPAFMDEMGAPQDQAVAACLNMWRDAWEETHPDGAVDPGPPRPGEEDQRDETLARARKLFVKGTWNEADHPRDPAGTSTGGQFTSGGGAESEKPKKPKGKGKAKREDFAKANITLSMLDSDVDQFIDKWNEKVGEDPAEFKKGFMGGLDGEMKIGGSGGKIEINGRITDPDAGATLGTFTRNLDLDNKTAASAYFKLNSSATGGDVGKKMLAGNVATYEELGIEKVNVFANIDVGGYAWAKYGYVPTTSAWSELRGQLERKLSGSSSSSAPRGDNVMEADSWDMLSSDRQDDVRDRWMQYTQIEFLQSEQQNWRDSGQAKDDAKRELAEEFTNYQVSTGDVPEWVNDALDGARKYREDRGESPIPFTNKQLYDAVLLSYESRNGDGEDDPDIDFDDNMLKEPIGFDPAQQTLPGIDPIEPHEMLNKEMRERIEKRLTAAFDAKAEENAQEIDPPSYLAESVGEYQEEYWDQMSDRDRLQHAIDFNMADIEIEPDPDEEPEMDLPAPTEAEIDPLLAAVRSSDPKSIWKIADNPRGKALLLGRSWNGVLNLKDPESMARFKAYVGKGEQRAA